jgi:hypothetical protein
MRSYLMVEILFDTGRRQIARGQSALQLAFDED